MYIKDKESDKMISIRKRGNVYQYCFEEGKVNGKRKQITKSDFKTKNGAYIVGQKSYYEFINGVSDVECNMLYGDYLDYWIKEYCELEYKYTTTKSYKESLGAIKNELGTYKLRLITPYMINQALLRMSQKVKIKTALRNYQKVIKSLFNAATNHFGFIKHDPAASISISKMRSSAVKKRNKAYLFHRRNRKNLN